MNPCMKPYYEDGELEVCGRDRAPWGFTADTLPEIGIVPPPLMDGQEMFYHHKNKFGATLAITHLVAVGRQWVNVAESETACGRLGRRVLFPA